MSEQQILELEGKITPMRPAVCDPVDVSPIPKIPGLHYRQGFLTQAEQDDALYHIDKSDWRHDLDRRVQHYGWRYDYRTKTITREMRIGRLPDWLVRIAQRLYREAEWFDTAPDQAIVNEYEAGQGIAMHIDRQCFGNAIATISLGDTWSMDLRPVDGGETQQILLEAGSALVFRDEARYHWLHGIAKRKREKFSDGGWRLRRRRVSLTFRTVLIAKQNFISL